jgi:hypothetical protein
MSATFESITSDSSSGESTTVLTKPTGLAVGDVMVFVSAMSGVSNTITPKTDWDNLSGTANQITRSEVTAGDETFSMNLQTKVAEASDVAASDFTWTFSSSTAHVSSLIRVSAAFGVTEFAGTVIDDGSPITTPVFTGVTPNNPSLLVMVAMNRLTRTASGYNIATSDPTWTERLDLEETASNTVLAIATGNRSQTTATGNAGLVYSTSIDSTIGYLLSIEDKTDGSATNTLLEVSPTFFVESIQVDAAAANTLHEVSPTFFEPNGTGRTEPVWTETTKPSDPVWTEINKP